MTIAEQDIVVHHVVGGATDYAVPFAYWGEKDLAVWHIPSGGLPKLLAVGTDYDLDHPDLSHDGGVVRLRRTLSSGQLVIRRETRIIQGFSAPPAARGFEHALDRMAMVLQEQRRDLAEGLSRTLRTPEPVPELPTEGMRAGRVLGFDGFGQPTIGPRWDEISGAGGSVPTQLDRLTAAFHGDWQPDPRLGPQQLEGLWSIFEDQAERHPEVRRIYHVGDIAHRATCGRNEVRYIRELGLDPTNALRPGDPFIWGYGPIMSRLMATTRLSLIDFEPTSGNHDQGRDNSGQPFGWDFAEYRRIFGAPTYWTFMGDMAFAHLGTEGGGVGGQIPRSAVALIDRVMSANPFKRWCVIAHHAPLGYGPLPDHVALPGATVSPSQAAAWAGGADLDLTIGSYDFQLPHMTPIHVGGRMLERGEYVYLPEGGAENETPPDTDPEEAGPPETPPASYSQIRLLRSGWLGAPLISGTRVEALRVYDAAMSLDPWSSDAVLALLRKHASRIWGYAHGHSGRLEDPNQRPTWTDPETGIVFFNNNMGLNSVLAGGTPSRPAVYSILDMDAAAGRLTLRRWAVMLDAAGRRVSSGWLRDTHGVDADFRVDFGGPISLGSGRPDFDSRQMAEIDTTRVRIRRRIAEAPGRQTPTSEIDPETGFPLYDKAAGSALPAIDLELGDPALDDSVEQDAMSITWSVPSGYMGADAAGTNLVSFQYDDATPVVRLAGLRANGAETRPAGAPAFQRARRDGSWESYAAFNGETGLVELEHGLSLTPQSARGPNLLRNSDFRFGAARWAATRAAVEVLDLPLPAGGRALRMTHSLALSEPSPYAQATPDPARIPIRAGRRYTLSHRVRGTVGADTEAYVRWLDAGGATIYPLASSGRLPLTADFETHHVTGVAPAGAVWAEVRVGRGWATGGAVTVDLALADFHEGPAWPWEAAPQDAADDRVAVTEALRESPALSPLLSAPLAQRHLGELGLGAVTTTGDTEVFAGAGRVPQGLAYVETPAGGRYFAMVRASGSGWIGEVQRLVEYACNSDLSLGARLAVSGPLNLGHQNLTGLWRDGAVLLYTAETAVADTADDDIGKGVARIRWRGTATSQADVTQIRLFGAAGSAHFGAAYRQLTPAVSTDGRLLILSAALSPTATMNAQGGTLFAYSLSAVEAAAAAHAGDATGVQPVGGPWRPPFPPVWQGKTIQGLACDGRHIARLLGYQNARGFRAVQILSLDGRLLREVEVDGARALYTPAELDGDALRGVPASIEPEGLAYVGDRLVLLDSVVWRPPAAVVTYRGRRWASLLESAGVRPDAGLDYWTQTTLPETHGVWSAATTYPAPSAYTAREKHLYAIEAAGVSPGQTPLTSGRAYPASIADLQIGANGVDISAPLGTTIQIGWHGAAMDEYVPAASLTGSGIFLFDAASDAPAAKWNNSFVSYSGNREFFALRARAALSQGTGVNLHGGADSELPGVIRFFGWRSVGGVITNKNIDLSPDGHWLPGGSSDQNIGSGARPWSTIYAATGAIAPSDARLKRLAPGEELTALAEALADLPLHAYQWLDAIALKGDHARLHVGPLAQEVEARLLAAGLNPDDYGLFCRDYEVRATVAPVLDEEGRPLSRVALDEEGRPLLDAQGAQVMEPVVFSGQAPVLDEEGRTSSRLSLRMDQLALVLLWAERARRERLEARVEALTGLLSGAQTLASLRAGAAALANLETPS